MMKRYECQKCGHTWLPRVEYKPVRCPHCTSPTWNKARKNRVVKPAKTYKGAR